MSSNSSKRLRHLVQSSLLIMAQSAAFSVWTVGSIFAVGGLLAGALFGSFMYYTGANLPLDGNIVQVAVSMLVYIIGLAILLVEPYGVRRMTKAQVVSLFGVQRWPLVRDIGYALIAFGGYMVLSVLLSIVINALVPGLNMDQEQAIGFEQRTNTVDIIMAFVMIVVITPIVEELVFRGYLYGSLRPRMPWWLAGIIVSAVFGAVHGQWNVGLDTFVMSMAACYLRERTGAIWAGIYLHAVKNMLAFTILFLLPEPLRQLIMNV